MLRSSRLHRTHNSSDVLLQEHKFEAFFSPRSYLIGMTENILMRAGFHSLSQEITNRVKIMN